MGDRHRTPAQRRWEPPMGISESQIETWQEELSRVTLETFIIEQILGCFRDSYDCAVHRSQNQPVKETTLGHLTKEVTQIQKNCKQYDHKHFKEADERDRDGRFRGILVAGFQALDDVVYDLKRPNIPYEQRNDEEDYAFCSRVVDARSIPAASTTKLKHDAAQRADLLSRADSPSRQQSSSTASQPAMGRSEESTMPKPKPSRIEKGKEKALPQDKDPSTPPRSRSGSPSQPNTPTKPGQSASARPEIGGPRPLPSGTPTRTQRKLSRNSGSGTLQGSRDPPKASRDDRHKGEPGK
ncbi:MAG: hypothetical protein M1828_002469 [Chrysothrix sp. TS-e1954]|nr:MAG: hypothetical protein M1828_002469 [Chrysothrix sp. TS-e1954]